MRPKDWDHMGDGVYVMVGSWGDVVLHANSHSNPTDRIVLDPGVLVNLLRYLGVSERLTREALEEMDDKG